jgi:hypothetical protein
MGHLRGVRLPGAWSRGAAARQLIGTYARSASGIEALGPGFDSRHLHSPLFEIALYVLYETCLRLLESADVPASPLTEALVTIALHRVGGRTCCSDRTSTVWVLKGSASPPAARSSQRLAPHRGRRTRRVPVPNGPLTSAGRGCPTVWPSPVPQCMCRGRARSAEAPSRVKSQKW